MNFQPTKLDKISPRKYCVKTRMLLPQLAAISRGRAKFPWIRFPWIKWLIFTKISSNHNTQILAIQSKRRQINFDSEFSVKLDRRKLVWNHDNLSRKLIEGLELMLSTELTLKVPNLWIYFAKFAFNWTKIVVNKTVYSWLLRVKLKK